MARRTRCVRTVVVAVTLLGIGLLTGCSNGPASRPNVAVKTLFTRLPAAYTGIDFANELTDSERVNVFTYRNYYNGGGVGVGDFNGDGLTDLYLTANQRPNRLFLNTGDFWFEDVTDRAGVAGRRPWSTGVSVVDVNGDGRLDLYVGSAGAYPAEERANELFINQGPDDDGIPRFEEQAAAYGLDDTGYTTHAAFFDYDRDGDLDAYVLNNSPRPVSSFSRRNTRHIRHNAGGDRLYRNDEGRFVDVSEQAGIYGSEIAFGLGVTTGDVNGDGWLDLYISNDFFERDYLYLNNQDGTFSERLEAQMPSISLSSMGADVADVNNDGRPDLYVTDMLPEDDYRLKTTSAYESWEIYRENLRNDYYHQFMRNMLHLNNGNGTFSEIGQIAGVSATDWSWGALFADFDGDGFKDLFVSNGIFRDVIDQDFVAYFASEIDRMVRARSKKLPYLELLDKIPSHPLPNYLFHNEADLGFTNASAAWGLATPSFSNGAAYADLDNDGDLDLVVNNVNMEAFVYRNETDTLRNHHYLQIHLDGDGMNRLGIGSKVTVHAGDALFFQEQMPNRGFQSSVDPVLTFGLGEHAVVDSVVVVWPEGRVQVRRNVAADQRLTFAQAGAGSGESMPLPEAIRPTLFADVTGKIALGAVHEENDFVDFQREPLLYRLLSTEGPSLAVADVNRDGRDDVFFGGAKESPGRLLLQQPDGSFRATSDETFTGDQIAEDLGAAFFDADGDGDLDLYVVSGGSEFSQMAPALQDRLYLNDGRGRFEKATGRLPSVSTSGSCVVVADYDRDGDPDLFVGGRLVPWRYGYDAPSRLLQNDGRGHFTDVTDQAAPALAAAGMVTDAAWVDVDDDGWRDLVVVGEWMPVKVFRNAGNGTFEEATDAAGLGRSHGLWTRLLAGDLDGDGDTDLVAGNWGLNSKLHASEAEPATLHAGDFDSDGTVEQIVSVYTDGKRLPITLRHTMIRQFPFLEEKYPTFASYAGQSVDEIFTDEQLANVVVKEAFTLETSVFTNRGDGTFARTALPYRAQLAPVYGLLAGDFDDDGAKDLLLAGNFHGVKPALGRLDASYGVFLRGDSAGGFAAVPARHSGFFVPGEARALAVLDVAGVGRLILVARNDDAPLLFQPTRRES